MPLDAFVAQYLKEHVRRADAILFTGAGFSRAARNTLAAPMPLGSELRKHLWDLCYPGQRFDENEKLEDLFQNARDRNRQRLVEVLRNQLTVDSDSIPAFYSGLFSLPWHAVYTLNVDDLAQATGRKHAVRRRLVGISAVNWANKPVPENTENTLAVVHLNGVLDEAPDGVTFSPTQYAERLAGQEPLYAQLSAHVLARPVIFIGTPLDETPLWQHVAMRKRGLRTRREYRRQSYIVTPSLQKARAERLEREFHVTHIPMDVEEFARELLGIANDVIEEGYEVLRASARAAREVTEVPLVQDFAAKAGPGSAEYLSGRSPTWGDVRDGVAADRKCDGAIVALSNDTMAAKDGPKKVILLSGTAGSGKSTAAMRLGLVLSAQGIRVGWSDGTVDISPFHLRRAMESAEAPPVFIMDDADRYGNETPHLIQEVTKSKALPLVVAVMRSGRGADRLADRLGQLGVGLQEYDMPDLDDSDILSLLKALDTHNRLGVLKGRDRDTQIRAFRDVARRQILVALLEATSGRRFEQLITSEFRELGDDTRDVYATVAVATALRFALARDELLMAAGDKSSASLEAIDALHRRHLLVSDANGVLRVRHRVIADVITKALSEEGLLSDVVTGLAIAAAAKVGPQLPRGHRYYRRIRSLMNHDWLTKHIGVAGAGQVFEELEPFVNWDHHYWLQRGSFTLEHGDQGDAENFLNQSYAIDPDDPLVQTELGYLRLVQAVAEPRPAESRRLLADGFALLRSAIHDRRASDPHQYHIYGKQALEWIKRADATPKERAEILDEVEGLVNEGRGVHPRDERLRELLVAVQNAKLGHS